MITVTVNFPAPEGVTLEIITEAFRSTTPRYEGLPGLIRKYYLFDPESGIAGGGIFGRIGLEPKHTMMMPGVLA